jgi:hypothetical protein
MSVRLVCNSFLSSVSGLRAKSAIGMASPSLSLKLTVLMVMEMGRQSWHNEVMIYSVQIVETRVVETADGETGSPAYLLEGCFSTIPLAEEVGRLEVKRRQSEGMRTYYNVFDPEGRPCGPNGPV